jgi:hypothetical protein
VSADSGEPEVKGRWQRGLGTTPEWKNPDWRSWGGRGLTNEAIRGGAHQAGRSGGEGPKGLSGP